eukprot:5353503-Pleurochrysis_carterae.AAC.1
MAAGDAQSLADADHRCLSELSIATKAQVRDGQRLNLREQRRLLPTQLRKDWGLQVPAGATPTSDREGVVLTPFT